MYAIYDQYGQLPLATDRVRVVDMYVIY